MTKVIIDMTMSLDGFIAGPEDGPRFPLGQHGGMAIFDWYFSGTQTFRNPLFKPEPGANLDVVRQMYEESGAFVFGRRTYDIANGWNGRRRIGYQRGLRASSSSRRGSSAPFSLRRPLPATDM